MEFRSQYEKHIGEEFRLGDGQKSGKKKFLNKGIDS